MDQQKRDWTERIDRTKEKLGDLEAQAVEISQNASVPPDIPVWYP